MNTMIQISGIAGFLDRDNVDTDAIIPKQFMKSIRRTGYGQFAFDGWRYMNEGELGMDCTSRPLNPDFELNNPAYAGATILITRSNFGCGSSREHAPWALSEYGFRAIIAESFADIFKTNCVRNLIAPIVLAASEIEMLFGLAGHKTSITIDLENQTVTSELQSFRFQIERSEKTRLMEGSDEISQTLKAAGKIQAFERQRLSAMPWLDSKISG